MLGAKFGDKIDSDGQYINLPAVTNALTRDYAGSQIIDYSGGKKPHTVDYLKGVLGVKVVTPPPATAPNSAADVVVILGADYAAKQSPPESTTPPSTGTGP